jgi:hypothetical protein
MDGHGVQKVLRDLVMGHRTAGMEGVYAHVTPESRAALIAADEADWNSSLTARAAISPTSPAAVLDALLAPFRTVGHDHSHLVPNWSPKRSKTVGTAGFEPATP